MDTNLKRRLRELHDFYAYRVNEAVEAGREHLIDDIVASYPDEASRIMEEFGTA